MTPMTDPGRTRRFSRSVAFAALLGYSAWLVFPMVWVAYSSLKPDDAIFRDTFALPSASDLRTEPWLVFCPIICLFLTVLSLNFLGDVVRAHFDVRESSV